MPRSLLLAGLIAAYAALFAGPRVRSAAADGFDPLDRRGRQVETAIETGRFADVLPVALSLGQAYPRDPVVLYWLAEIYRGIGRTADEIAAWEAYARVSSEPDGVCPALPEAYARLGDAVGSRQALEQCAQRVRAR